MDTPIFAVVLVGRTAQGGQKLLCTRVIYFALTSVDLLPPLRPSPLVSAFEAASKESAPVRQKKVERSGWFAGGG